MSALRAIGSALIPPLCAACGSGGREDALLCRRCASRLAEASPLAGMGPPGLDNAWSSAAHEGVPRQLVVALKFRRLLPVAEAIAERIERLAPTNLLSGAIVSVPSTRMRTLTRGFEPAAEIAAALAERTGMPLVPCLVRSGGQRQVGRRRAERIGHPPHLQLHGEAPRSALLVDDVLTTGATLSACARALRGGGGIRVAAVTFTRRP